MRTLHVLALVLFLAGCDGEGSSGTPDAVRSIAFAPGVEWTYRYEFEGLRVAEADTSVSFQEGGDYTVSVVAAGETVSGVYDGTGDTDTPAEVRGVTRVETRLAGGSAASAEWYRLTPDRLTEVAYETRSPYPFVQPRQRAGAPFSLGTPASVARLLARPAVASARGADSAAVYVRRSPRTVFAFPLDVGRAWEHYDLGEIGLRSTRRVTGYDTLEAAGRVFRCAVVETTLEAGAGSDLLNWTEWVAEEGIVRREIRFDTEERGPENEPTGARVLTTERMGLLGIVGG